MHVTALRGDSRVCAQRAVGNLVKALLASSHALNKRPSLLPLLPHEDNGTYLIGTRGWMNEISHVNPATGTQTPGVNDPSRRPRGAQAICVQGLPPLLGMGHTGCNSSRQSPFEHAGLQKFLLTSTA